jgi:hypothetical protein
MNGNRMPKAKVFSTHHHNSTNIILMCTTKCENIYAYIVAWG